MNMSNALQFLPLVQALSEGKTLQVRGAGSSGWSDCGEVYFGSNAANYRIKPEPEVFYMVGSKTNTRGKYNELLHAQNDLKQSPRDSYKVYKCVEVMK